MTTYIAKRLVLMLPVLLGVTVIVFILIRLVPGDAVDLRIETAVLTEQQREEIERQLGLDKPVAVQYLIWLGNLAQGDFGDSLRSDRPVGDRIKTALPISLEIALLSSLITVLVAIPVGVISAIRQDTFLDYGLRLITIGALSIPSFWIATMFLLVASRQFGWAPPQGYIRIVDDPVGNLSQFLPAAAILGVTLAAIVSRMVRSQMLEVLRQDYIRTAWAKGLSEQTVVYRHALRNAFIPVLTILGTQFSFLLGSTVVIESIFSLPGIGRLTLDGIVDRDYPLLQASIFIIAASLLIINLLVDVAYAWVDPRIRYA